MKSFLRFVLPLLLGLLLGVLGSRYLRAHRALPAVSRDAVTVNGEPISMGRFEEYLKFSAGRDTLESLVAQKLIEQEAARRSVVLTFVEEDALQKAIEKIKQPEIRQISLEQGRNALMARHLLLDGVTEKEKREVYELYKDLLKQYEISVIVLATRQDGRDVAKGLAEGLSFELLARSISLDPSKTRGGLLGWLTMPQICRLMGDEAGKCVAKLKPDSVGNTIYSERGLLVLKLGKVRSSYEQLKPVVESVIAESRRADLMYGLIHSAKISSPFQLDGKSGMPETQVDGILPKDQGDVPSLPRPEGGDSPGKAGQLPEPGEQAPGAQDLPKPY